MQNMGVFNKRSEYSSEEIEFAIFCIENIATEKDVNAQ